MCYWTHKVDIYIVYINHDASIKVKALRIGLAKDRRVAAASDGVNLSQKETRDDAVAVKSCCAFLITGSDIFKTQNKY